MVLLSPPLGGYPADPTSGLALTASVVARRTFGQAALLATRIATLCRVADGRAAEPLKTHRGPSYEGPRCRLRVSPSQPTVRKRLRCRETAAAPAPLSRRTAAALPAPIA